MSHVEIRNYTDCNGDRIEKWYLAQEVPVRTSFSAVLRALRSDARNWEPRYKYFKDLDKRHQCDGLGEIRFSTEGGRLFRALGFFQDAARSVFIVVLVGEKRPVTEADLEGDDDQPSTDEKGNGFYIENCKPVQQIRWQEIHGREQYNSCVSRI